MVHTLTRSQGTSLICCWSHAECGLESATSVVAVDRTGTQVALDRLPQHMLGPPAASGGWIPCLTRWVTGCGTRHTAVACVRSGHYLWCLVVTLGCQHQR